MAVLGVQNGNNSRAAQREWIQRYGNANVPSAKTFKRMTGKLLTHDPTPKGFENQNIYATRVIFTK